MPSSPEALSEFDPDREAGEVAAPEGEKKLPYGDEVVRATAARLREAAEGFIEEIKDLANDPMVQNTAVLICLNFALRLTLPGLAGTAIAEIAPASSGLGDIFQGFLGNEGDSWPNGVDSHSHFINSTPELANNTTEIITPHPIHHDGGGGNLTEKIVNFKHGSDDLTADNSTKLDDLKSKILGNGTSVEENAARIQREITDKFTHASSGSGKLGGGGDAHYEIPKADGDSAGRVAEGLKKDVTDKFTGWSSEAGKSSGSGNVGGHNAESTIVKDHTEGLTKGVNDKFTNHEPAKDSGGGGSKVGEHSGSGKTAGAAETQKSSGSGGASKVGEHAKSLKESVIRNFKK